MDLCKRDGLCCVVFENGKWIPCQFQNKNKTCSVYDTRIGRVVKPGVTCTMRELSKFNYPGCAYNKEGQELHPAYR